MTLCCPRDGRELWDAVWHGSTHLTCHRTNVLLGAAHRTQGSESAPHTAACLPLSVWKKQRGWRPQLWCWLLSTERKMWVFKKLVARASLREEVFVCFKETRRDRKEWSFKTPKWEFKYIQNPLESLQLWPDIYSLSTFELNGCFRPRWAKWRSLISRCLSVSLKEGEK